MKGGDREADRKSVLENTLEGYSAKVLAILKEEAPQSVRKVRFFRRGMEMPEIILLPERTEEEERTLNALRDIFLERYRDLSLYERYAGLKQELSRKLSAGSSAFYSAKDNTIVLNSTLSMEKLEQLARKGWTKLLRRSIMQADRDSGGQYSTFRYARGRGPSLPNDEYSKLENFGGDSIPDVENFFSLLQPVIDASVDGRVPERDEAFTLSSLEKAHRSLKGVSLEARAEEAGRKYRDFVEKVYDIITFGREKKKEYIEALADFLDFAGLYEPAAPLYFRLVLDSAGDAWEFRDSLYRMGMMFDIAGLGFEERSERVKRNNASHTEAITSIYSVEDDVLDSENTSFYIAKLAVNEKMGELSRSWPDLFFRDDSMIYRKYVLPVYSAVNRMRSDAGRPPLKPSR